MRVQPQQAPDDTVLILSRDLWPLFHKTAGWSFCEHTEQGRKYRYVLGSDCVMMTCPVCQKYSVLFWR